MGSTDPLVGYLHLIMIYNHQKFALCDWKLDLFLRIIKGTMYKCKKKEDLVLLKSG